MSPTPLHVETPDGPVRLPGDRPAVVGRGRDADVVVADSRVSRRHVELAPDAEGWTVRDVSANGMWSGGRRTAVVSVRHGEVRVRLGAADGPELVLVALRPTVSSATGSRPAQEVGDMATVMAGARSTGPGVPHPRSADLAPAGAAAVAEAPPTSKAAAAPPRWARTIPTLAWLAAAAFAVGALVALS
jgi:predicted component of type VI protein secretion system